MKIAWFDIETTGFISDSSDVVEVAVIIVDTETGARQERQVLVKPTGDIPASATRIHGITTEEAKRDGYSWKIIGPKMLRYLHEADAWAGHNIKTFDIPFLRMALKRLDLELESRPVIDTLFLSRTLIPKAELQSKRLEDLAIYLEVREDAQAHRALNDVIQNILVLEAMMGRWNIKYAELVSESIRSLGDHNVAGDPGQMQLLGWPRQRGG